MTKHRNHVDVQGDTEWNFKFNGLTNVSLAFINFHSPFTSGDNRGVKDNRGGQIAGSAVPGGLQLRHGFQKPHIVLLDSHQEGTKQRLEMSTRHLVLGRPLGRFPRVACRRLRRFFLWRSDPVIRIIAAKKSLFGEAATFQISQLRTLCQSAIPRTFRKNPISTACTWVSIVSVITSDSWPWMMRKTNIKLTDSQGFLSFPGGLGCAVFESFLWTTER